MKKLKKTKEVKEVKGRYFGMLCFKMQKHLSFNFL